MLLSHNHISLLQGLLDRPGGMAASKHDLIAAALPYVRRYRVHLPSWWTLSLAVNSLHPRWVDWKRLGSRKVYTLLPRGRGILDGRVPARIVGIGPHVPRTLHRGGLP